MRDYRLEDHPDYDQTLCGQPLYRCRNKECNHAYRTGDGIINCPDCGLLRGLCTRHPVPSRTKCKKHGGRTLRGPANPNYRSGRYSAAFGSANLQTAYERALSDPDILALDDEIALRRARLVELLGKVDSAASEAAFDAARDAYTGLRAALKSNDRHAITRNLDALDEAFGEFAGNREAWREIWAIQEGMRKLVDSAQKHRLQSKYMLSVEVQMALLFQVVDLVKAQTAAYLSSLGIDAPIAPLLSRLHEGVMALVASTEGDGDDE